MARCGDPKRLRRRGVISMSPALLACAMTGTLWAADPQAGEDLARRWCASCHVVASDQSSGIDGVPPFAVIAANPAADRDYLVAWLSQSHEPMPDFTTKLSRLPDAR